MEGMEEGKIKEAVRERYTAVAQGAADCCGGPGGSAIGIYPAQDLSGLPEGAVQASAGCGNPIALGELRPGDTVLDLGSGGGMDCFLAARAVGREGRVIGVDMTPDMVALAQKNAATLRIPNVEFRAGEIERLPVESESIDIIISNCVINLSPDKDAVFREAHRVLRPGGRMCVSDIVLLAELPPGVGGSLDQWAECVSGALPEQSYLDKIKEAGFTAVEVLETKALRLQGDWRGDRQCHREGRQASDVAGQRCRSVHPACSERGRREPVEGRSVNMLTSLSAPESVQRQMSRR